MTVLLGACGEGDSKEGSNTGGVPASGGQAGAGGRNTTGGQPATGGQNANGGRAATGGANTTGGQPASGGQSTSGGQAGGQDAGGGRGGTAGQTAGTSSGGASAGASASAGAQNGGGGGATPMGGGAGTGGAPSGECTRALLDSLFDQYFAALSAGDPSSLPLAANLKFTENAEETQIGTTTFWMNAGETKHSQRALDTEACTGAAQAVIPENGMDLPVAVRIKVEGSEITEIETIVVRPGDYTASFAVDSNPAAIIALAADIGWHDEVPQAERATRQQLISWIDKYFRAFPAGVCNVTAACRRLENGGGNSPTGFSCASSCSANTPTTGGVLVPRLIIADEVRGIAAGFTIFDFQTTGHLDMHMMKMSGGQVHAVQAILRDTGGESGWD
jgi:hypothetical protein